MTIRVVIADDQEIVRAGFSSLLDAQADITVVGSAADGVEALRLCREQRPDVVLMDVRMPTMDGIEATRKLAADRRDGPRVLILTTFDLDEYVYDALQRRSKRIPTQGRRRRKSVPGGPCCGLGRGVARPSRHSAAHQGIRTPSPPSVALSLTYYIF